MRCGYDTRVWRSERLDCEGGETLKLKSLTCNKEFLYPALQTQVFEHVFSGNVQYHVCPFCNSKELDEIEKTQPTITSIKQVDIAEADALIKEGYVVEQIYAKNVVLVKKTAKELEVKQ
jgi:hypothetical protein